jgi:hypothetical protein
MARTSLIEGIRLTPVDPKFWGATAVMQPTEVNYTYALGLWDLVTESAYIVENADPAHKYRNSAGWFRFPTPPQTYELAENAATNIVATQNGGKFVESQGSLFKDIRLSGTVGLRPNPVDTNLIPSDVANATGLALTIPKSLGFLTNDERGLPKKEITGFDDITFLRNLFRGYWNLKRNNEWARRIVMIWVYQKDSDIFIVEPMNFTATKDKSNPLSYTYSITLRTLYKYDIALKRVSDPVDGLQDIFNVVGLVKQSLKDITVALTQLTNLVDYIAAIPFRIADTFVGETIDLMRALVNVHNTGTRLNEYGTQAIKNLSDSARTINQLNDILHQQRADNGSNKDAFTFLTPYGAPVSDPNQIVALSNAASESLFKDPLSRATLAIWRAAERLLAGDPLFETVPTATVTDYSNIYNRSGAQYTVGSPLDPNNIVIPSSASEDVVGGNESLRAIAKRTMGDESYWKMLAICNNLKPPYIAAIRGDGVLQDGDKIMIPRRATEDDITGDVTATKTDASMEALSILGKKYGRDIRLSNGSSGTDYADLVVSSRGDLATIEDVANVNQAMMIKTSTERGELAVHPTFGARYPIGSKLSLGQLQEFAINTRTTLLSDPRVKDIAQLRTFAEGDTIRVYAEAVLKQTNVNLPVQFTVRRV